MRLLSISAAQNCYFLYCLDVETMGMKTPNNIHNSTENPESREGFDLLII